MSDVLPLVWVRAGRVPYAHAHAWQRGLVELRHAGAVPDVLLTLEHPPVYTAGRHADVDAHVLGVRPDIPLVQTDRGGDVTYHGPGQLVAYPIVKLRDGKSVRRYIRALERAIVAVLAQYGVEGRPGEDVHLPGVWVGEDKIAAIGVRVQHAIAMHGLALNVDPDLGDFAGIVPCGIAGAGVCSLASLGVAAPMAEVEERLAHALAAELGRMLRDPLPGELPDLVGLSVNSTDNPTRSGFPSDRMTT